MQFVRVTRSVLAVLAVVLSLASVAEAQSGARSHSVGVGGMVGDPTGLSMKFRIANRFAIDLGVGWKAMYGEDFQAHVDFLWGFDLVQARKTTMLIYVGVGPKVGFWGHHGRFRNDTADDGFFVGARVPIGLDWEFLRRRLDVFVEVAPALTFFPEPWFYPDAAAGARFWF